ncbi:DUF4112 domain-containing protein [Allosphingosinicella sp.]|uniref:DUF4112 domain-containing protein n=1 Tax=Allosphingosinicella sp. TaxID=2823234 RepID=UPI00378326A4
MAINQAGLERLADRLPVGRDAAAVRQRIEAMERVLERAFTIPGTRRKIGLDVILDLVPIVGDTAAAVMGAWLVWEARNLGMSKWHLARMAGNVAFDWLLGLIPFIGAIPDFFFRSNTRNLRIVKRWLDKHHPATGVIEGRVTGRPEI